MFFEVRFLAALASWLCRLHRFGLFLADELGKKFGQQFFSHIISVCLSISLSWLSVYLKTLPSPFLSSLRTVQ